MALKITFNFLLFLLVNNIYAQANGCELAKIIPEQSFSVCENRPWVLVFEDEFEGNSLDITIWDCSLVGSHLRYCNNEQQYYTYGNNHTVSNGTLKIIAKKEITYAKVIDELDSDSMIYCGSNNRGRNLRYFYYTSEDIQTKRKFLYGKFEARVKIPKGKGLWPAFWLYGENPIYNELDIFEFWNEYLLGVYLPSKLSKVHRMNVHYKYKGVKYVCPDKYSGPDFSQDFHIFTVIWDKEKIQWLVDGELKRTYYHYYDISGQAICDLNANNVYLVPIAYARDPMHLIFNLAIQGGSDSPDENTPFPCQMEIDWVRVYQRFNCTDIIITNQNQFSLLNNVYNVITGKNVSINNFVVHSGQHLTIIATNTVNLGNNFIVEAGAELEIKIVPNACDNYKNEELDHQNLENNLASSLQKNKVKIFPNPNNGIFTLYIFTESKENKHIEVYNILGYKIIEFDITKNSTDIDISSFPKGTYFIKIQVGDNLFVEKIIFL